jgi:hypothetical protein
MYFQIFQQKFWQFFFFLSFSFFSPKEFKLASKPSCEQTNPIRSKTLKTPELEETPQIADFKLPPLYCRRYVTDY